MSSSFAQLDALAAAHPLSTSCCASALNSSSPAPWAVIQPALVELLEGHQGLTRGCLVGVGGRRLGRLPVLESLDVLRPAELLSDLGCIGRIVGFKPGAPDDQTLGVRLPGVALDSGLCSLDEQVRFGSQLSAFLEDLRRRFLGHERDGFSGFEAAHRRSVA